MLLSSRFLPVPSAVFSRTQTSVAAAFLSCYLGERDPRPGMHIGIAPVVADELLGQDSNIVNRAREKPDMVEAFKASEQLERFERFELY